jgi:hypothetical protein
MGGVESMKSLKKVMTPGGWSATGKLDVNTQFLPSRLLTNVFYTGPRGTDEWNNPRRTSISHRRPKLDLDVQRPRFPILLSQILHHSETLHYTPTFLIVIFEAQSKRAWVDAKPDVVIMEAQERLRLEGWTNLRPALSTTIRAWIMRGFLEGGLRRAKSVEVEFLGYALEVLDWGSRVWKDVPKDDRGAIFERTFIRGVRSLHIRALVEVCMHILCN